MVVHINTPFSLQVTSEPYIHVSPSPFLSYFMHKQSKDALYHQTS